MQEAFDKLRGVDIFSLKSYMEPTGFASFNGAWVLINEFLKRLISTLAIRIMYLMER